VACAQQYDPAERDVLCIELVIYGKAAKSPGLISRRVSAQAGEAIDRATSCCHCSQPVMWHIASIPELIGMAAIEG
jgi:hypothetical protein